MKGTIAGVPYDAAITNDMTACSEAEPLGEWLMLFGGYGFAIATALIMNAGVAFVARK